MRVERLDPGPDIAAAALTARGFAPAPSSVEAAVREIIDGVRTGGDAALAEFTRRFDGPDATDWPVRVDEIELAGALDGLDIEVRGALEAAGANVRAVALAGLKPDREVDLPQGQRIVLREIPVRRCAIYVPAGKAPYPSTVVMGTVTAQAAGVEEVVVCAPPSAGGTSDPTILGACALLGVTEVHRMGGAQAIAALALGTETIVPVDVIAGPGNLYVQEAKRLLAGDVGIDSFAGPSDLLIVLGNGADPRLVALDLLAQAEHGPGTVVAAVAVDSRLLDAVAAQVDELAAQRPSADPAAVVLVAVADMEDALAFANAFAPEHLELVGEGAETLAPAIKSAGCVFVGGAGAVAFGDYIAGSNHILPTDGSARFGSGLGPGAFRRTMAEVHVADAAPELARIAGPLARAEGFFVHAESMEARIGENAP